MTDTQMLLIGGAVAAAWYLSTQKAKAAASPSSAGTYVGTQAPNTPVIVSNSAPGSGLLGSDIPFGPIGAPTGSTTTTADGPLLPDGSMYLGKNSDVLSDPNGPMANPRTLGGEVS